MTARAGGRPSSPGGMSQHRGEKVWIRIVLLAALVCLGRPVPIASQQINNPEIAIHNMIDSGIFDGHDEKLIAGTGDSAAVIITKILAGRDLTARQIDNTLAVLNMAFGSESNGPDAEPRTALFILRELDLSTNDAQLRARIAQTRKYIQEEFSKSAGGTR
jgi:hypothetical protein